MISIVICDKDESRANDIVGWVKKYFDDKDFEPTIKIIHEVKSKIMIVDDAKIYIRHLNYVDIEGRSLCYHMSYGYIQANRTLRTSFEKAMYPYLKHENLLFLKPSLLINLSNIKALDKERILFKNGDILYYPSKHHNLIKEKWGK